MGRRADIKPESRVGFEVACLIVPGRRARFLIVLGRGDRFLNVLGGRDRFLIVF
jgi:hypothetical protein